MYVVLPAVMSILDGELGCGGELGRLHRLNRSDGTVLYVS